MRLILPSIILVMAIHFVTAQTQSDTIRIIEHKVKSMDQQTNYWISTFSNEAFLDTLFIKQPGQGYGRLTGYFLNGKICKISEVIGIKLLQQVAYTDYYFEQGKLIYVYEEEHQGPDIFIDSAGTVDQRIEMPSFYARYYFTNGKMIERLEEGERKTMLLPDEKYFDSQSKEGQLLYAAQKYLQLFSIKYK